VETPPSTRGEHMVNKYFANNYGNLRRNTIAAKVNHIEVAQKIDEYVVEILVWESNYVLYD
ncbi:hypothetical protein Q2459_26215, partial [Escherichia coli]|nr:hypothetical protein [Escherichia coli]